MSQNYTLTCPANGTPTKLALGSFVFAVICSATNSPEVSFNGETWQPAKQNAAFGPLPPGTGNIFFRATNGVDSTVTFTVGETKTDQQDTSQSQAPTSAAGNLGIANGAAAAGALPACDANGFLQITNGMLLKVPGTSDSGNRRQILILSVSANGAALQVLVSATVGFMSIAPGATFPLVSDADFYISGSGGTAKVTIGEFYLKNNA